MPFPAGGGGDVLTRMVAEKWTQLHGISTVVENRPGGAATCSVLKRLPRAADGNTLGIVANSFIIHPNFKKLSYDPLTSFEPVCLLANSPQSSSSTARRLIRRSPNGSTRARQTGRAVPCQGRAGEPQHIAFEQLKLLAKVNITFVPFNGNTRR